MIDAKSNDNALFAINDTPLDDFCGLTSREMHQLLYYPYGKNSPLQVRSDIGDETLDGIPFFRLMEELLRIIRREGFIRLTPLGALPRKVLQELYSHRLLPEEFIESGIVKLSREND